MNGMQYTPCGYGGRRRNPEKVKREGWQEQRVLAVSLDDHRLTWPERELVRQLGYAHPVHDPEVHGLRFLTFDPC